MRTRAAITDMSVSSLNDPHCNAQRVVVTRSLPQPVGLIELEFVGAHLVRLSWPPAQKRGRMKQDDKVPAVTIPALAKTVRALERYAKTGKVGDAQLLAPGTPFKQKVWGTLRNVPCGETVSYGKLAAQAGAPGAARAIGGACAVNPLPIFVPCHRVIAAGNRLGGFSGGIEKKVALLRHEGVGQF